MLKRGFILGGYSSLLALVAMSAENETGSTVVDGEVKERKSIVPAKYGNKYKNGGTDELAQFINAQATGKEGFEYPAFFDLCRKNGLPEEKVALYEGQVAAKAHGSQGRARMTLRNMLATIARKNGKLVGLNGDETAINIAKPAVSGAAAKAQEQAAAATETESAVDEGDASEGEDA